MRLTIMAAALLLSLNTFATVTLKSSEHSCSDLKTIVKAAKSVSLLVDNEVLAVHSSSKACFEQGLASEFLTVKAGDKTCVVGLVCDIYGL